MSRTSIPLLGIPILNRGDLLKRLVNSIDFPIDKLVVVNNGNDAGVTEALDYIQNGGNENIRLLEVIKPARNLGVAPSWNVIIQNNPDVPYWMICANDMMLKEKGDLQSIFEFTEAHLDCDMLFADGYSWFTMLPAGVVNVGYFDENFFPAYMEDVDHWRRVGLAKAHVLGYPVTPLHGEAPTWGSHTIYANPNFRLANGKTHGMNNEYYTRKWGGLGGNEAFQTPFGNPDLPLTFWQLDQGARVERERYWGV